MRTTPEGVKFGFLDELLLLQVAVLQRDLADLELHAACHQRGHRTGEGAAVGVLRAFHQEVDAVGMGHHGDLRGRVRCPGGCGCCAGPSAPGWRHRRCGRPPCPAPRPPGSRQRGSWQQAIGAASWDGSLEKGIEAMSGQARVALHAHQLGRVDAARLDAPAGLRLEPGLHHVPHRLVAGVLRPLRPPAPSRPPCRSCRPRSACRSAACR